MLARKHRAALIAILAPRWPTNADGTFVIPLTDRRQNLQTAISRMQAVLTARLPLTISLASLYFPDGARHRKTWLARARSGDPHFVRIGGNDWLISESICRELIGRWQGDLEAAE